MHFLHRPYFIRFGGRQKKCYPAYSTQYASDLHQLKLNWKYVVKFGCRCCFCYFKNHVTWKLILSYGYYLACFVCFFWQTVFFCLHLLAILLCLELDVSFFISNFPPSYDPQRSCSPFKLCTLFLFLSFFFEIAIALLRVQFLILSCIIFFSVLESLTSIFGQRQKRERQEKRSRKKCCLSFFSPGKRRPSDVWSVLQLKSPT